MKSTVIKIVIGSLFIGVFNLIFFLSGITLSDANWCTYAFVMLAYLCLLTTPLFSKGTKSGVLAGSLWLRAILFFITELVIAAIWLAVSPDKITWPLITQATLFALFLIFQLMSVLANDATEASMGHQKNLSFTKQTLLEQLHRCLRSSNDAKTKQLLNQCIDSITYSPLETCPEAYDTDQQINEAVNEICYMAEHGGIAEHGQNINLLQEKVQALKCAVQNKNLIVRKYRH